MARIDHKEVQLLLLKRGVDAIEKLIEGEEVSAHILRRALVELEAEEELCAAASDVSNLRAMLDRRGFLSTPLAQPEPGEERGYKSYEADNSQYIRVNVTHFGEPTGSVFPCRINIDDIKVGRPKE